MTTKHRTYVLAITSDETLDMVHEALGGLNVRYVDVRRLRRDYGSAVASEVLCQLVRTWGPSERPARRQ